MNTTAATNTARPAGWAMSLACLAASLFCAGALAATQHPHSNNNGKKHAPSALQNPAAPRADADDDLDNPERFLLLSSDGISITQTAFASARQCEAERKRTLQRNPRLARYVAQGEADFECVSDDAGSELPYQVSIIDKSTGVRADFSMRTQAQCEIGMSHAKAAGRRYTILSRCHQRPLGQA
ncbi:MAG: hypothetical protein JSS56_01325 [Proteobacteria bacterium]|nr:hypothetical protein [Pseudomonadota bacterium]